MKPNLLTFIACLIALVCGNNVYCQSAKNTKQKPKTSAANFTGKWKGAEKCTDASAPVALLYVTGNGSEILLTGIYSIQGEVNGTIKGDTLYIYRQEVKDPNFTNLLIEGKLAYGINPFNLSGQIIVHNNQKQDECLVKYYK